MRRIESFLLAVLLLAVAVPLLLKRVEQPANKPVASISQPSEKKDKALSLPVVRVPASIPNTVSAPAAIQADLDKINSDWDKTRDDLYARFNLSEQQQAQIQEARAINARTVGALAKDLSKAKDQERERLVAKIAETEIFYDRAMTEILGEKNFAALESLSDSYNSYVDSHSDLRPKLTRRW